jgi:hypothetical protein
MSPPQTKAWSGNASFYDFSDEMFTPPPQKEEQSMLEKIIKMYYAYMMQDVRSPIPHLAGPPGVGKSTVVQQLADMLGVKLHIINVSRLSPLELEGVQMPVGNVENLTEYRLHLLTSTIWTQLNEGDIVLLDEFMRGFPEVYNGLLDIMTSREVAGFKLPKVFFIGASNSVAAYDKALEDRLLHVYVPDIRKSAGALMRAKWLLVDELGLNPKMVPTTEMTQLFDNEVAPMYDVLDQFQHKAALGTTASKGQSLRKLIGQVQLREVQSSFLKDLIQLNNMMSMQEGKAQFVVLLDGKNIPQRYEAEAKKLKGNPKLTQIQADNINLNLQLIEMQVATTESTTKEGADDDDVFA